MSKLRYFQVQPGRVVIPPRGVVAGPGATNLRYEAGETLELPDEKVDRFIRGRVRAGDLVEVKQPAPAREPKPKATRPPPGVPELDLAASHGKKEG